MQAQSGSVLDAYIASQANPGSLSGSWTSLQEAQAALQRGQGRQGAPQPPSRFGSAEALAFSSNAAANFGQDFRTLVRPHPQHHQISDPRTTNKPPVYANADNTAFAPAPAWQRHGSAAIADPWSLAQPRQPAYGYGPDNSMSSWQQQIANMQQPSMADQHAQPQHQAWALGSEAPGQQAHQQQQQHQNLGIAHKPSSGDQLVQDLRAHWGSMASSPHQPQANLNADVPHPLPPQASQSGFEHMWAPANVPGLSHHSSVGLGQQQAAAPAAARLPDDFPVLDFPDWDGPGAGGASLDDMIMNSIGVPGASAGADSLLPQSGQDMLSAEQPHAGKAASKKKQKGGRKAASKGAKGARAASGSTAHAEHSEDGPIVEFFVATPENAQQEDLEPQGTAPEAVAISKLEPKARRLPPGALSAVTQTLPRDDPGMHLLHWTFGSHFPKTWKVQ
ncbi:hypothetical protein WJX79_008484 [Trebouxia sp. C0005]